MPEETAQVFDLAVGAWAGRVPAADGRPRARLEGRNLTVATGAGFLHQLKTALEHP